MKEMWRHCQELRCLGWAFPKLLLYMVFASCEWRGEGLWDQACMPAEPLICELWQNPAVLLPLFSPQCFQSSKCSDLLAGDHELHLYGFHILESKPLVKHEHKYAHCHQMYSPQMNCMLLAHQHRIPQRIGLFKKFWAPLPCWWLKQALNRGNYGRLDLTALRSCSTISIVQTAISNTFCVWDTDIILLWW